MNFQQLRFVVAVADTSSFTSAADLCCVTQPALSNAIAQLEDELGSKLFERTTRSVSLTSFGEAMIDEIRAINAAKSQLLVQSADYLVREDRTIRIGMSPLVSDTFVETMMRSLAVQDRALKVVLSEMNKVDIHPALDAGEIHFGLGPEPLLYTDLGSLLIYREPLLYVTGVQLRQTPEPATVDILAGQQILLVGDDCGLSTAVRRVFDDNQITMAEYEGKALSYGVLEKWARLGIGVALLPASKVMDLSFARHISDEKGNTISIGFHAVWTHAQESKPYFTSILKALQSEVA